jgi:F0F1-type ATP synthase epsilon subunit
VEKNHLSQGGGQPLKIKIITPREIAYDGTGLAVTIPAEIGEMQV